MLGLVAKAHVVIC